MKLVWEQGLLFVVMTILGFMGSLYAPLQYMFVFGLLLFLFQQKYPHFTIENFITYLLVAIHPLIHATTMYNDGFFQTNITWDLTLHTTTALLSLWSFLDKPLNPRNKRISFYLLITFIGCVLATWNAYSIQIPNATGEHTSPWITVFPTLSVINFTILNICEEIEFVGSRLIFVSMYTLIFYVILVFKLLPVSTFLKMQYAENYFVCAMLANHLVFHL